MMLSAAVAGCSSPGATGDGAGAASACSPDLSSDVGKTYTAPPAGPNPAAKGKNIAIIAVGMSSPTVAVGATNVEAAAKSIGWTTTLYDAKLDPANFPTMVRAAVTSKVDGIIGVGLDAPLVTQAVQEATAAGVPTISVQGWDLNDDPSTRTQAPIFTTRISFGNRYQSFADAMHAYGAASAKWTIVKAGCHGTILDFANNEYTTLKLLEEGFSQQVKNSCPGCKLVSVPWLAADFGPQLTSKVKAALLRNPDATVANGATNPTLGITQGVTQSGSAGKLQMIGGFGVAADYDALRSNQGLTAVNSWPLQWWSYAAVDTLNSYFNKTPARDEGLGFEIVDATHDLPPTGQNFAPSFDVPAAYAKSWGAAG
jgi:ribose transport system substrate-binding protein